MKILFLSTWFPYPPNQGSKIRAYHLLNALAKLHDVGVVSFQDGDLLPQWLEPIQNRCAFVEVVQREPFAQARMKSMLGWFSPKPRAVYASYAPEFADRVRQVADRWDPEMVVALTFVTAPYALKLSHIPRVLDVDILLGYMLLEEYLQSRQTIQKIRRYIAYRKFERYERRLFPQFDLCLVTSARDRDRIMAEYHLPDEHVGVVPNGVDLEVYQPELYPIEENTLVFNGALTYHANYDAMDFFLSSVFPRIQREVPDATLSITGTTKEVDLRSLELNDHVILTGYVEDIRTIVARSQICVVPLRKGAGTRLKILEAMALGVPVISTHKGAEGLNLESGVHAIIVDNPDEFATETIRLLQDPDLRRRLSVNAHRRVYEQYAWSGISTEFQKLIQSLQTETDCGN